MGITRKQWAMLAVLVFGTFVCILNQTLITPAQPTIMAEMQVDASTVQWLTTGFTLVNAVMIPISAYLTDRFSTRRLFSFSMSIFAAGALVVALSPVFGVLLLGRIIQACGAGVMMPLVMTVLLLTFPTDKRGTAMGLFGVVMMLAPALGPTVSGVIIDHVSWHYMYFGITLFAVACVVASLLVIEKEEKAVPPGLVLDKPSVVLSTLGFGGVLYGLSVIGSYGLSAQSVLSLVVGAVILVFFFKRQLALEVPMLEMRVLKTRKFLVATVIGMVVQASIMANGVLIPIYVQTLCGQSATVSGLVMLPGALIMGVMSPVSGRIFDKRGPRGLAVAGAACLLAGTLAMTQVNTLTPMLAVALIILMRNLGMGLLNMPLNTWGMNALPNKLINHGNAVGNTFRQVAGSFGCALVISVYSLVVAGAGDSIALSQAQMAAFNIAFWVQVAFVAVALFLVIFMVKENAADKLSTDPDDSRKKRLSSIMHPDVYSLSNKATVAQGLSLLLEKGISAVPIIDDDGCAVGFFSDGDIMRALGQNGKSYTDPVSAIMVAPRLNADERRHASEVLSSPAVSIAKPGCVCVDVHDSVQCVCRVMGENHLKKVLVKDGDAVVGVINRSDIIRAALALYQEEAQSDSMSGPAAGE